MKWLMATNVLLAVLVLVLCVLLLMGPGCAHVQTELMVGGIKAQAMGQAVLP